MKCKTIRASALLLTALSAAVVAGPSHASYPNRNTNDAAEQAGVERTHDWPDAIVELASGLPIQDDGRIKPLSTVAGFTLLKLHHSRSCKDTAGARLEPMEWLLDVLFFPEQARAYPLFRVQTHEVLQAVGVSTEGKKKRDLYSYDELEPGIERLFSLARSYSPIDPKDRTPLQGQIWNLAQNVGDFQSLLHALDFTRTDIGVEGILPFAEEASDEPTRRLSEITRAAAAIVQSNGDPASNRDMASFLEQLTTLWRSASRLSLIPPTEDKERAPEWDSPGQLAFDAINYGRVDEATIGLLTQLESMADARNRPEDFQRHLESFAATSNDLATARGEARKVGLEVRYYALDPFYRALMLYVLAFVMVAITWARPGMRRLFAAAQILTAAGFVLHATGIVMRCVIRSRPPISTLYETVIFVAAGAVLVPLIIERIDRRRLAGAMAPILGTLGLFIAMRFEELKGEDTMPQLVAVLDTNFWLAIHVTCITMGYSAGLLASAFGHVYVLGKVFGIKKDNREAYRSLGKTVYGTLCFALLFSIVGTILGGIWANDSWGRFWGWDPKENGALMIVLAQLALLHGRMGGFLKPFGVAMATIAQGIIVAFSWWGVNLLGIGLHSYGFTDGIWSALILFYSIEGAVLALGVGWWLLQRRTVKPSAA